MVIQPTNIFQGRKKSLKLPDVGTVGKFQRSASNDANLDMSKTTDGSQEALMLDDYNLKLNGGLMKKGFNKLAFKDQKMNRKSVPKNPESKMKM